MKKILNKLRHLISRTWYVESSDMFIRMNGPISEMVTIPNTDITQAWKKKIDNGAMDASHIRDIDKLCTGPFAMILVDRPILLKDIPDEFVWFYEPLTQEYVIAFTKPEDANLIRLLWL